MAAGTTGGYLCLVDVERGELAGHFNCAAPSTQVRCDGRLSLASGIKASGAGLAAVAWDLVAPSGSDDDEGRVACRCLQCTPEEHAPAPAALL